MTTVHDFDAIAVDGTSVPLQDFAGKVLLIVNTASKCGLTPQYEGLEQMYRRLRDRGLEVLGFPCNQFLEQEPGSDTEIQDFCRTNFDVSFPMFAKVEVNGSGASPLYGFLRSEQPGNFGPEYGEFFDVISKIRPDAQADDVKWNFTKFLVDRDGKVIKRYESPVSPADVEADCASYL